MSEMVTPYIAVDFACVREDLYEDVKDSSDVPVFPIELYRLIPGCRPILQMVSRFRDGDDSRRIKLSNIVYIGV